MTCSFAFGFSIKLNAITLYNTVCVQYIGGDVQYIREITMSTSRDTIIHVGEQIDKSL